MKRVEWVEDGIGSLAGVVQDVDREEVFRYGRDEKFGVFWRVEGQ